MSYKVVSTYKYVHIEDPTSLMEDIRTFCKSRGIKGRILLGEEGLNAAFSGDVEKLEEFKSWLLANPLFSDLTFREQFTPKNEYNKLVVRVREEIVCLGVEANMDNKGPHVSPTQLKAWLDNNEDIILLDARNDYEMKVGKFKGAIELPIKSFREFPEEMKKHPELKKKKIVMYCTGGVRCEKSSAYLKEQGFEDVSQLQGGIINYINQFPDTYYEGGCFVFDERLVAGTGSTKVLSHCSHCGKKEDTYENCSNLDCDTLYITCKDCKKAFNTCCSEECVKAPRHRPLVEEEGLIVGKVLHYYSKAKVAHIEIVHDKIFKGENLVVKGKTTHFSQRVEDLWTEDKETLAVAFAPQRVTIPVQERVRENDIVRLPAYDHDVAFLAELEEESVQRKIPIVGPYKGSWLFQKMKELSPKRILELGTASGYSGCILGSQGAEVVSIELNPKAAQEAENNFKKYNVNVNVIIGDVLEEVKKVEGKFDLIFVDFSKNDYLAVLEDAVALLNKGGCIIADNISFDSSKEFKDAVMSHPKLQTEIIDIRDGLSFSTLL